ncbi:MAG TPA: aminoglycoside phosphotransferase family protein [Thermomicrobiales bacterium]|nr:aminoglycoside phosphotransferase family protein [Thermomicrobiales bacterium]
MTDLADLPALTVIAHTHRFAPPTAMPVPWTGATGQVFPCDDVVIKVPFDRPDTIQAVTIDSGIVPFVRSLGVAAPALIAFDDSRDILPVPFAVFRRVPNSTTLDARHATDAPDRQAWEEVGRQLARVHAVRDPDRVPLALRTFRQSSEFDPRPWVRELRESQVLNQTDAQWLDALLDALLIGNPAGIDGPHPPIGNRRAIERERPIDAIAPRALADVPVVLCHGDVNAANVLVDYDTGRFRALIDWAGAGWLDPAWDFAGVSLDIVPAMLAGHRSVAPLVEDGTAEARILWCQIQTRLYPLRVAPASAVTKRTVGRHLDQIRRFARAAGYA